MFAEKKRQFGGGAGYPQPHHAARLGHAHPPQQQLHQDASALSSSSTDNDTSTATQQWRCGLLRVRPLKRLLARQQFVQALSAWPGPLVQKKTNVVCLSDNTILVD
jgi:hypothetical protein